MNTYEYDVIILGSGLAGLHYCMHLLELNPKAKIALISKTSLIECNSRYAQGGIATVCTPHDTLETHIEDTILAGDGLCYKPNVEAILQESQNAINTLRHYGIKFNKNIAKEGGHSHRRVLNCGDETGFNLVTNLIKQIQIKEQVSIFENHTALHLILHEYPHCVQNRGEVLGAYILNCNTMQIDIFLANSVIIATGGSGKIYRYTSNPEIATGDGLAMAYRAGARVGNMEFYQFHPTLLYHQTLNNFLISEAVRGEGGILLNADTGKRFMQNYAPEKMELATRDIVARAIFTEMENSASRFVYLDITHQSRAFLKKRFPQIYNTLLDLNIDMSQDRIPVVPAAHYQCGGIVTDSYGRTDLKRLYAIGEVAFTGLHGANRLASNSLLEASVMAIKAASASLQDIKTPWEYPNLFIPNLSVKSDINPRRASQINAHWRGLRGEMTSYAGIVRTKAGLIDLLQLIKERKKIIEEHYWTHSISRDTVELRNIVLNAELLVEAALARRESRGVHYREDYPNKNIYAKESIACLKEPEQLFRFL